MFVFDERVQISQSNVLALVRDFLYQDPLPNWYIKEALSEEHLADSKGSHWVDFFAWDEVYGLEYAVKHGRITLAEGTTIETLTSSPMGNNNKEKVFTIVGTRLENRELTNEWGTFTVPMVTDKNVAVALVRALPITENICRIRIVLTEFDPPVMRHIENLAYYILERTESNERAENWRCKQTSPEEPTAKHAAGTGQSDASLETKLGAGTSSSKAEASWTILDEYIDALRSVCLKHDASISETTADYDDRSVTRTFTVRRLDSRFESTGSLHVVIDTRNLEWPVMVAKLRVNKEFKPTLEEAEHHQWQNAFVNDILNRVSEIRKEYAKTQRVATRTHLVASAAPTSQEQTKADGVQAEPMPRDKSKRKGLFGLRIGYLIAGIVLGIFISIASWFLFPDWARSNLLWLILFPIAFAAATNFIANFRKAYE